MCLSSISQTPQIAITDIEVFKIVRKKRFNLYYTPFQDVLLKEYPSIDNLEKTVLNIKGKRMGPNFMYPIESEGIHCYTNILDAKNDIKILNKWDGYATTYLNIDLSDIEYSIVKGIIPEGTKYWVSRDHKEIASRYIRFEVSKFQRFIMTIRYWYLYLYKFIFKE